MCRLNDFPLLLSCCDAALQSACACCTQFAVDCHHPDAFCCSVPSTSMLYVPSLLGCVAGCIGCAAFIPRSTGEGPLLQRAGSSVHHKCSDIPQAGVLCTGVQLLSVCLAAMHRIGPAVHPRSCGGSSGMLCNVSCWSSAMAVIPFKSVKVSSKTVGVSACDILLQQNSWLQGDIVVRQGDLGSEMYFIGEGILEARIYQDERGSPLHKATYMRSMTRQHKRAGSITQSRRQSAGAGKTQRDSMETTASDSSFTLLRSESSFSRLSIAVQQATDSAMRVARSSRLGKRLLRKSDSSDVGGGSLNRPIGVSDGELEPPTPRTNGRKGSHTGSITSPSGHHDGKKRHSTLLEEPAPHQRPLRTKKMFDKYMFIDELGHRPYR